MAAELISPPVQPSKATPWERPFAGPACPPVDGLNAAFIPKGVSVEWLLDVAWGWFNTGTKPEVAASVRVPPEEELLRMEREAPMAAAFYRQQIAETIEANKRSKVTRTLARILALIEDQYGQAKRD